MHEFQYKLATREEITKRWDKNIADNPSDEEWVKRKAIGLENFDDEDFKKFVIMHGDDPIGEGTLIFEEDNVDIQALRIDKHYEGQGHISKLVKVMEQYARDNGCTNATIGVEPNETRNMSIYFHWGYTNFEKAEMKLRDDEPFILYYSKKL